MHPAFNRINHRPWPLPASPWHWRQSWCDLLFAHWPIPAAELQPLVPPSLEVQEFDGTSWVGIVPFRMEGVMLHHGRRSLRPLPDLPWISAFPELNVRLYVERDGKPGVWFLSLDAANRLAVWAARRFFHLPYYHAAMQLTESAAGIDYHSQRLEGNSNVLFTGSYRATSTPYEAQPNTLEHWLTERYCLYAESPSGELYRAEVHHMPWPLQKAEANIEQNSLLAPHGLSISGPAALLHFARRIDVVVWSLERIEAR